MKTYLKVTVLILMAVVLQTSVLPHYLISPYKPDILLVIMVFFSLRAQFSTSFPAAYGLGLLKDCLGGMYLGLNGFSFIVVCLVLKAFSDRLYVQSSTLLVLAVAGCTVATMLINLLLLIIFSESPGIFSSFVSAFVPHLLMNCFVASIISLIPAFSSSRSVR